jgi:hypothetical protein
MQFQGFWSNTIAFYKVDKMNWGLLNKNLNGKNLEIAGKTQKICTIK